MAKVKASQEGIGEVSINEYVSSRLPVEPLPDLRFQRRSLLQPTVRSEPNSGGERDAREGLSSTSRGAPDITDRLRRCGFGERGCFGAGQTVTDRFIESKSGY